jgi:RimJ/RimL family protein N-acetyltransferase
VSRTLRAVTGAGPRAAARKLRRRVWSGWETAVLVRVLDEPLPPAPGMRVELVEPQDFDGFRPLLDTLDGDDFLFVRALERTRAAGAGDLVVGRDPGGAYLGSMFFHRPRHTERLASVAPGLYGSPGPDEVLTDGLFSLPALRGQGVGRAILASALQILRAEGIARAYAHIDADNRASLRTFTGVGYRDTGRRRSNRYRLGRFATEYRD